MLGNLASTGFASTTAALVITVAVQALAPLSPLTHFAVNRADHRLDALQRTLLGTSRKIVLINHARVAFSSDFVECGSTGLAAKLGLRGKRCGPQTGSQVAGQAACARDEFANYTIHRAGLSIACLGLGSVGTGFTTMVRLAKRPCAGLGARVARQVAGTVVTPCANNTVLGAAEVVAFLLFKRVGRAFFAAVLGGSEFTCARLQGATTGFATVAPRGPIANHTWFGTIMRVARLVHKGFFALLTPILRGGELAGTGLRAKRHSVFRKAKDTARSPFPPFAMHTVLRTRERVTVLSFLSGTAGDATVKGRTIGGTGAGLRARVASKGAVGPGRPGPLDAVDGTGEGIARNRILRGGAGDTTMLGGDGGAGAGLETAVASVGARIKITPSADLAVNRA